MSEIFYWKGGDTYPSKTNGNGLASGVTTNQDYVWNNPKNWFVVSHTGATLTTVSGAYASASSRQYERATRIPHGNDIVNFKALGSQAGFGLSGGPWPKTPCLAGGFVTVGNTSEWWGSYGNTAERQGRCRSIVVHPSYSQGTNGWEFGSILYSYLGTISVDGNTNGAQPGARIMTGLSLGADIFAEKASGERVVLQGGTFGDMYSFGKTRRTFKQVDTVNLLLAGSTTFGGSPQYNSNSFSLISSNVSNAVRIEGDHSPNLAGVNYSDISIQLDNKVKSLVVYPENVQNLNFYAEEAEDVILAPQGYDNFSSYQLKSNFNSDNGISIDNLTLLSVNPLTGSTTGAVGGGSSGPLRQPEVQWEGGTIGNLQMSAGRIKIAANADDRANIIGGAISGTSTLNLDSPDLFSTSRIGTGGCSSDNEGLLVKSEQVEIKFKSGTLVNSVTGISAESVFSFAVAVPSSSGSKFGTSP